MKLTDSKVGDVLYFYYTPENGQPDYRLARVEHVGSYYINTNDLKRNGYRTFSNSSASKVEVVAEKDSIVISRKDIITELGPNWKPDTPGKKLCTILPIYKDDISSANYHEVSDSIIIKYKEKQSPLQERLEVEVREDGFSLTFINKENEKIVLNHKEGQSLDLTYVNKDNNVTNGINNPVVKDLVSALNLLFK